MHDQAPVEHRSAALPGRRGRCHLRGRRHRKHRTRASFELGEMRVDDVARDRRGQYPCSACSASTTPAIWGRSRGAKNANQPWSRRSRSVLPAAARPPSSEMTCAVPVFPATSRPSRRARPPVPAALTTIHNPSCSAATVSRLSCAGPGGVEGCVFHPLPSSMALRTWGVMRWPPFATAAYRRQTEGRHRDLPLADGHRDRLAGVHFSPVRASFHAVDGTRLGFSLGMSMPVRPPRPRA